jgi:hypothetical protein
LATTGGGTTVFSTSSARTDRGTSEKHTADNESAQIILFVMACILVAAHFIAMS